MKALSDWQPYATLMIIGEKEIETRGWATNYRGTLAIHAARKSPKEIYRRLPLEVYFRIMSILDDHDMGPLDINELPTGAILGTVQLVDCVPIEALYHSAYDTRKERDLGDWSAGRYGWILKNPVMFKVPILARGSQGLWNWERTS